MEESSQGQVATLLGKVLRHVELADTFVICDVRLRVEQSGRTTGRGLLGSCSDLGGHGSRGGDGSNGGRV